MIHFHNINRFFNHISNNENNINNNLRNNIYNQKINNNINIFNHNDNFNNNDNNMNLNIYNNNISDNNDYLNKNESPLLRLQSSDFLDDAFHYHNNEYLRYRKINFLDNNLDPSDYNFKSVNNKYSFDPMNIKNFNIEKNNFGFKDYYAIFPTREAKLVNNNNLQFNSDLFSDNNKYISTHRNTKYKSKYPNSSRRKAKLDLDIDLLFNSKFLLTNDNDSSKIGNTTFLNQHDNLPSQNSNFLNQTTNATTIPAKENNFPSQTTNAKPIGKKDKMEKREKQSFDNRFDQPFKGIKTKILSFWGGLREAEVKREDFTIFDNIKSNFIHFFTENTNKSLNRKFRNSSIKEIINHIYKTLIPARIGHLTMTLQKCKNKELTKNSIEFLKKSLSLVNISSFNFDSYFTEISNKKFLNKKYYEYMEDLQKPFNLKAYINGLKEGKKHTQLYIENAFLIITKFDEYLLLDKENTRNGEKRKIRNNFKEGVVDKIKETILQYI